MNGIFLTGATGLLGRHLLRDLLLADKRVVVLVRPGNGDQSGRQRIDEVLRHFESQAQRTLPRPMVVEGCLRDPDLGLSLSDRQLISAHCTAVLHCAASVKFQRDADNGEPFLSNVTGTKRLLDYCVAAGIYELHHVSTAYVCGGRTGAILEDEFEQGQRFRNDYEHSKFTAEQLLRESSQFRSLTIYRPSIIVGDFESGYTSTFHGFYLPLQLVYAATSAGYLQVNHRGYLQALGLNGDERKNVVPVDWVSSVIVSILQRPGHHGRTYHVTNPEPVTTRDIEAAIGDAIGESILTRTSIRPDLPLTRSQAEEFRKQMEVYGAYLSDDPEFDSRQTLAAVPDRICPRMDHASLVRMARYAIRSNFGWPRIRPGPAELDVASLMDRLPKDGGVSTEQLSMTFEVSGSSGGMWRIAVNQGESVVTTLNRVADVSAYMNVYTLRDILRHGLTVERAVAAGRVVLEGTSEALSRVSGLLEALCTRLRESE